MGVKVRFILYEAGSGEDKIEMCICAPLHDFDNMLMKSVKNRIQRNGGKQICVHWCSVLHVYARACLCVCVPVAYLNLTNVCVNISDPKIYTGTCTH